ncbi:hypothetical protein [Lactobacillus johnsonii]|uniref:Uncharacterized protein n=1 Tax=Lactobacillus johnsonii TaxID=33959 RepID=A0A9X0LYP5_LACJH|nr:hypothetical protein [Lactobacillus johnsonii]KXN76890.1 hypothetical protein AYJ53_07440 [Lactobacillus johnsonii]
MKCILWKTAGEQPSDKLIEAFHAKKIDGYYVGELTEDAIKKLQEIIHSVEATVYTIELKGTKGY